MSLYGKYVKERENREIVETDHGFATFQYCGYENTECYIIDLYVLPDHRKKGVASQLADRIAEMAKEKGCQYLSGSVDPTANGATDSVKTLLAYGFDVAAVSEKLIWFKKEL